MSDQYLSILDLIGEGYILKEFPLSKYRKNCPQCKCERLFFHPTSIRNCIYDHCDSIKLKEGRKECISCNKPNSQWRICPFELATEGKNVARWRCQECMI